MTLKLTLFSQEKEDFVREILIDSDAKFSELHRLILTDCQYGEHQRQCFLICDEDWRVKQRISLHDSEEMSYDQDLNLMSDTSVGDFLEEEGQRLAYVFDPEGKRFFLMELTENVFGRTEKVAIVNRRHGLPPVQSLVEEEEQTTEQTESPEEIEEGFYGDEGFEAEELDMEGYEIDE
ncbi:MAG: hypothetical protein IJ537_06950 [Bacteroidaceae bacterium]|nr:hypothetical protein [Bacteroidaceae bacterium]